MITETVSEKKKRGRPPHHSASSYATLRAIYQTKTPRSLNNKIAQQIAFEVLTERNSKPLDAWLHHDGQLRQGILVELGRMLQAGYSAEIVKEWAELICREQVRTRVAQRWLRAERLPPPEATT